MTHSTAHPPADSGSDFGEVPLNHRARLARIAARMQRDGIDYLVLTSLPSLAYVANVYQSLAWYVNTCAVMTRDGATALVVPHADVERISHETWVDRIETWNPPLRNMAERKFEQVVAELIRSGLGGPAGGGKAPVIGVEGNLTWVQHGNLVAELPAAEFKRCEPLMNALMVIKEPEELPLMRKVASLCDIGFEAAVKALRPGLSEVQLCGHIEYAMRQAGCDGYWVPNQCGTGETVLLDHYPTQAVIKENHIVKFGIHPAYKLYRGDICVTTTVSKPTPAFKRLADVCTEATEACIAAIKPGVRSCDIDAAFRMRMEAAGYGDYAGWYIGHGIGTGHQPPFIAADDTTLIEPNMIIVINTLAVKKGEPGVVYETMVLVTDKGHERLNRNPIHLVELG